MFKDKTGRSWDCTLSIAALKRIKTMLDVDLLDLLAGGCVAEGVKRVILSPQSACDVLYVAVKPQADAAGLTDEQFGELLAGQTLADGLADLLTEIEIFFEATQGPAAAAALRAMRTKRDQIAASVWTQAREQIEAEPLPVIPGGSSGGSPENSESTPAR